MLRSARLAALLVASAVLAACGSGSNDAPPDTSADAAAEEEAQTTDGSEGDPGELIALEFGPPSGVTIAAAAPYTSVPLALGYFEDEGLDVTINESFSGSVAAIQALDAGQLDIAMGATSALISAVANGADITAFYTQITENNQIPAVPADSPIEEPLDLVGTTIGVQSLESASVSLIQAMVQQEGGDPDSIDFVAAGSGLEALNFLEAGRVDAIGMWDAVYAEIEALGQPLRLVANDYFSELGFHMTIMATDQVLAEDEDVLGRFARALSKGMVFAQQNPEAAIHLHWEVYPEAKPAGVSDDEALEQAVRVLTARNENTLPAEGLWGNTTVEQVERQLELQRGLQDGLEDVQVDDVWSDMIITTANDFDEAAVRAEADDYTP